MASMEATASRKLREYRHELERSKDAEKEARRQFNEAVATSRSVQSTLAAVVAEKEKIIKEHEDMKAVCEELMAIVESGQPSST
jgi:hypothetical protein